MGFFKKGKFTTIINSKRLYQITKTLFFSLAIPYFLVATYYYIMRPAGGDEAGFIADLLLIKNEGWITAIERNISIPFMFLATPFSLFFTDIIALRISNLLIIIAFFFYLKDQQQRNKSLFFYLIFFIGAVAYFFFGTNDALFTISLTVFLNEVYKASKNENFNISKALLALTVAIFTRFIFIIYLPVIVPGLILMYLRKRDTKKFRILSFIVLPVFFLLLNLPSILENGTLSYDRKPSPENTLATWTQRQYLSQIQQNNGDRKFLTHPGWEETDAYLKLNGPNSLPYDTFSSITHNIPITIKEFFKDLSYIAIFHIRTLGFILIIFLSAFFLTVKRKTLFSISSFAPMTVLVMVCLFSFIIISHVEMRWLGPIFLLTIIAFSTLETEKKLPAWPYTLNYIILSILIIYGSLGIVGNMEV